jgi:predicted nucleic acid-binding protein
MGSISAAVSSQPVTSGTTDKTFVDTNVLIYAHDVDAGRKHEIAKTVVRELWVERSGLLSTQVLQEFYVNATRKIRTPLAKPVARAVVRSYAAWCVDGLTPDDIAAAFQIEDDARIGFWDAVIIAVAIRSGARRLLSEDLNPGQAIAGLAIHNPFAA